MRTSSGMTGPDRRTWNNRRSPGIAHDVTIGCLKSMTPCFTTGSSSSLLCPKIIFNARAAIFKSKKIHYGNRQNQIWLKCKLIFKTKNPCLNNWEEWNDQKKEKIELPHLCTDFWWVVMFMKVEISEIHALVTSTRASGENVRIVRWKIDINYESIVVY